MILTTTGCYGTGSSAITDLIREFDGVTCVGDNEIRLLHDPDGVSDLEYNLIENPNRHNTSHSIKRFKKRMEEMDHIFFVRRFRRYFGDEFLSAIDKYVDRLTLHRYNGMWHYDVYERGKLFYIISRSYSNCVMLLVRTFFHRFYAPELISKKEKAYLATTDEEVFLKSTRQLVDDLAGMVNKKKNEYVFLDQLVPPSNFERYIRYVSDIRIILVERDPRDIFLSEKEIWKGRVAPTERVEDFCKWYSWTRNLYKRNAFPEQVLFIQFEDLIYHYEKTRKRVLNHFGIIDLPCKRKQKYFNPKVSAVNTQLWKRIHGYDAELEYIENHLKEYCYNFEEVDEIKVVSTQKAF